jgi:DNA-directed RNA polymerase subunit RPC12/RpoP
MPVMPVSRLSSTSIASLVAAGTVVVIGGVATFVYLRSRSVSAGEEPLEANNIAGFGLCESCGEELATSGPALVELDDEGEFIVCDRCSHKNRARSPEDED